MVRQGADAIRREARGRAGGIEYLRSSLREVNRRVGKGALAPCPPLLFRCGDRVGTLRFAHSTATATAECAETPLSAARPRGGSQFCRAQKLECEGFPLRFLSQCACSRNSRQSLHP